METPSVITRPLVPRALWTFYESLKNSGLAHFDLFPLFHPKVSVFVDPDKVDREHKDVAFRHSVDLVLMESPPNARPRIAIDFYHREEPAEITHKRALFHAIDLPYRAIEISNCDYGLSELRRDLTCDETDGTMLRPIANDAQWAAMSEIQSFAESKGLYFLHEVALSSVIDIDAHVAGQGSIMTHNEAAASPTWRDQDFLRKTPFDGLLCTRPPNSKPIIAIEYDGAHHRNDIRKIENDARKDRACEAASIPIVRITSGDLPAPPSHCSSHQSPISVQDTKRKQVLGVLRYLIGKLADEQLGSDWYLEQLHHFLALTAREIAAEFPLIATDLLDYNKEMMDVVYARLEGMRQELETKLASSTDVPLEVWDATRELDPAEKECAELHQELERNMNIQELEHMLPVHFSLAIREPRFQPELAQFQLNYRQCGPDSLPNLTISSSQLVELGGHRFKLRFDSVRLEITVKGDRFGIATHLAEKGMVLALYEQAYASLEASSDRVVAGFKKGLRKSRAEQDAKQWNNYSFDELKDRIDQRIDFASRKSTKTPEEIKTILKEARPDHSHDRIDRYSYPPKREFTPHQIFQKVMDCQLELLELLDQLIIAGDKRRQLREHLDNRINAALAELTMDENKPD